MMNGDDMVDHKVSSLVTIITWTYSDPKQTHLLVPMYKFEIQLLLYSHR